MPTQMDGYEQNSDVDDLDYGLESETEIVNLSDTSVNSIQAELVRMVESSAKTVTASEVEIRQGGAGTIESDRVIIHQGFVARVNADKVEVSSGAVGIADTNQAVLNDNKVLLMSAGSAEVHNSRIGIVFAQHLQGESIHAKFLISNRVDGSVDTILDTPRVILAGLTAGIAFGLVYLAGRLLIRER